MPRVLFLLETCRNPGVKLRYLVPGPGFGLFGLLARFQGARGGSQMARLGQIRGQIRVQIG